MVRPDQLPFSERSYVAPSVYLYGSRYVSAWNYYSTMEQAIERWKSMHNQGGSTPTPAGFVSFTNNGANQTIGINCDFYTLYEGKWQLTSYNWVKQFGSTRTDLWPPIIVRMLLTSGAGPYFMVFEPYYFGAAAISTKSLPPEKLVELDNFYRAVQLMKFRYNALVGFLNYLSRKELNSIEQKFYNEGMLILNSFNQQIATIKGLELSYTQTGAIGALPIILIIAIIAILATATAWAVSAIVTETEKTKRIADSYNMFKWVGEKKQEVAQQVTSGQISQQSANAINKTLDQAANVAERVATDASKGSKGVFDNLASIAMWAALGFVGYGLVNRKK